MAKKLVGTLKLQVPAGQANPSPPVGPALGQRGINIMEFCKAFNAKTADMEPGAPCPNTEPCAPTIANLTEPLGTLSRLPSG